MRDQKVILAVAAMGVIAACSGPGPDGDPDVSEADDLGTTALPLSTNEDCDTVSPDRTTSNYPGNWVTGTSYGTSGCAAAYRVNANTYIGKDEESEPQFVHSFEYGDTVPTSQGECEAAICRVRLGETAGRRHRVRRLEVAVGIVVRPVRNTLRPPRGGI